MTGRYAAASRDIISEDFDGDAVVLNLASGQYFGMNGAASAVWSLLMAGVGSAQIAAGMRDAAGLAPFLERLVALGLIAPSAETAENMGAGDAARLAALAEAPVVDVFDDLSDLILADPIHDVDADMGWPHSPAPAADASRG
ncbi:PqqD family protein [Paragemmobacter aquarius]|nr:PqqD family protein [Gemmobacter aquarius]